MSDYKKGDIVRYGKEKYKIDSDIRQIPYGEHNREKVAIIDEKGKRFWVDVKDLKPEGKSLDSLIKDSLNKNEKEIKENEQKQTKTLRELQKQSEKAKKSKPMSLTIITRDYAVGATNGYRPKETVITGETKDGINFAASVYGKISREEVSRIAENKVKDLDLTEARLSRAAAQAKINMMLADNSADYVVFLDGADVTALEFNDDNTIKEAENLEDFGDDFPEPLENSGEDSQQKSLAELAEEAGANDAPSQYSSQTYDNEEQEFDDLLELSGIEDITERGF